MFLGKDNYLWGNIRISIKLKISAFSKELFTKFNPPKALTVSVEYVIFI